MRSETKGWCPGSYIYLYIHAESMVSGHMMLDVSHMASVTHFLIVPTILKMIHPLFMRGKYAFPDWLASHIILLVTSGCQEFADWALTLCNWCSRNRFLNNCNQPPATTCQECREHTFWPQNQLLPVGCWPISRPVWLGSYSLEPTLSPWLSHIQNTWPYNVILVLVVTF